MLALSDIRLQNIGRAFEKAWDRFLQTGLLTRHNIYESQHILATRILRSAGFGERDSWKLARDAVDYLLEVLPPAVRRYNVARCFKQAHRRGFRPRRRRT